MQWLMETKGEREAWEGLLEATILSLPEEVRDEIREAVQLNLAAVREAMQHITIDLGRERGGEILAEYMDSLMRKKPNR